MSNEKSVNVTVESHEGGFVVYTPNGSKVVTSLQKAMKLVKDSLVPGDVSESEKQILNEG